MLVIAIIATVILSIKILIGWIMWIVKGAIKRGHTCDDDVKGAATVMGGPKLLDIYLLVTIWILYSKL